MEIFDYDNILLLPRKCRVESRSECDAGVELGSRKFRLPVVPANMKTVVDESICEWLARNGYFYVMHRFDLDNVKFVQEMHAKDLFASISLGVKKPDYATVDQLVALGLTPEYITIDIAHGHADSVRDMITYLKKHLPGSFVIAGNVATPEAVIDLENWGADATKVGVGPGKVCITKLKTGFGTGGWQAQRAQMVCPCGHQAHHCRRRHPQPWRHCQEHPLRREHGHDRFAICWSRRVARQNGGSRWRYVQGVLRLGQRLQQGRIQTRRRQAHPGADQGQAGRHAD